LGDVAYGSISDFNGLNRDVCFPQIALQNSKNGFQRFLREKSNQAIIAGHAHLDRALITAQLTGGVYVPRAVLLVHSSATA
jgi:hypothetical protein